MLEGGKAAAILGQIYTIKVGDVTDGTSAELGICADTNIALADGGFLRIEPDFKTKGGNLRWSNGAQAFMFLTGAPSFGASQDNVNFIVYCNPGNAVVARIKDKPDVKTVISLNEILVRSVGFVNDFTIYRYRPPYTEAIDFPDGSTPIWTSPNTTFDPVCYAKNQGPILFAKIGTSLQSVEIENVSLRVGVLENTGYRILGRKDGLQIRNGFVQDQIGDGIVHSIICDTLQGQDKPGVINTSLNFEVSFDGKAWSFAGTTPNLKFYIIDGRPTLDDNEKLFNFALSKACGYLNNHTDIPSALRTGVHQDVPVYNPGAITLVDPLQAYAPANQTNGCICGSYANLVSFLARTVGAEGSVRIYYGGAEDPGLTSFPGNTNHYTRAQVYPGNKNQKAYQNSIRVRSPGSADLDFSYHAVALVNGTIEDAALDVEGEPDATPLAKFTNGSSTDSVVQASIVTFKSIFPYTVSKKTWDVGLKVQITDLEKFVGIRWADLEMKFPFDPDNAEFTH